MRTRAGVTLMELIVALTITGLMAAIGTATFGSIIDNKRVVKEATANTERAAALRETLRQWLLPATIQIVQGTPPRGTNSVQTTSLAVSTRTANGAEAVSPAAPTEQEIKFTTNAPNPANAPNAIMRVFIDEDESTPEHGLTLEYQATQQAPLQRRELDSTVQSLTVEVLDQRTGRWSTTSVSAVTPRAIRLTLKGADNAELSQLLQLPLVFASNSYSLTVFRGNSTTRTNVSRNP